MRLTKASRWTGIAVGWAALAGVVGPAGCQCHLPDTTPAPRTENGYTSWAPPAGAKGEPVPGIDFASVDWGTWDNQLAFAVWVDCDPRRRSDSRRGVNGLNLGPGSWEVTYSVRYEEPDVQVECRCTDGPDGSLAVNGGRPHDLSLGRLFLVSTAGGGVRVRQLDRPGRGLRPGPHDPPPDVFTKLKADPEVRAFFESPKAGGKAE